MDNIKFFGQCFYGVGIAWLCASFIFQGLNSFETVWVVYALSNFIGLNIIMAGAYLLTPFSRAEIYAKYNEKIENKESE